MKKIAILLLLSFIFLVDKSISQTTIDTTDCCYVGISESQFYISLLNEQNKTNMRFNIIKSDLFNILFYNTDNKKLSIIVFIKNGVIYQYNETRYGLDNKPKLIIYEGYNEKDAPYRKIELL